MRLGIDLGGTKIAAVVLGEGDRLIWEARVATPRDDYAGTVEAIAALVEAGERAAGARCSVGIGMPGAISPATSVVKNANSTWLNGRALDRDLEARLARPLRFANDANCLGMSEAADGAGAGARVVFAAILGTGTGGGVTIDGQMVTGANAIGGEWGHNPLPWPRDDERPGVACYCGRSGCIETFLSGPGISADYARRGGDPIRAEDVVARAAVGEPRAAETMRVWTERLARALATIINVLDPDVIVCGGGLSRLDHIYRDVPAQWTPWVFSDHVVTRLLPARHGDASGVRGAARLWPLY